MRVFVILPAAGLGTRMAPGQITANAAKQFQSLAGLPILVHSLRAFAAVPQVSAIVVNRWDARLQPFRPRTTTSCWCMTRSGR
jgi:2-C-methyl-D-erythritol 4-phosphate cytidylyltransferase